MKQGVAEKVANLHGYRKDDYVYGIENLNPCLLITLNAIKGLK
jgi:hypothetical protein